MTKKNEAAASPSLSSDFIWIKLIYLRLPVASDVRYYTQLLLLLLLMMTESLSVSEGSVRCTRGALINNLMNNRTSRSYNQQINHIKDGRLVR